MGLLQLLFMLIFINIGTGLLMLDKVNIEIYLALMNEEFLVLF